jgi:hypothetical protein
MAKINSTMKINKDRLLNLNCLLPKKNNAHETLLDVRVKESWRFKPGIGWAAKLC